MQYFNTDMKNNKLFQNWIHFNNQTAQTTTPRLSQLAYRKVSENNQQMALIFPKPRPQIWTKLFLKSFNNETSKSKYVDFDFLIKDTERTKGREGCSIKITTRTMQHSHKSADVLYNLIIT